MKKRFIAALLSASMLFGIVPGNAVLAEEIASDISTDKTVSSSAIQTLETETALEAELEELEAVDDELSSEQAIAAFIDEKGDVNLKWWALDANGNPIEQSNPPMESVSSFIPAYKVEMSYDGENYEQLMTFVRTEQSKILMNPITYNFSGFESNTTYYFRVTAYSNYTSGNNDRIILNDEDIVKEIGIADAAIPVKQLAFPTAEGGGKYATGGRGGDVYVVTSLEDNHEDPQPGTLRYGLERKDKGGGDRKKEPRTIVFAVGGTINLTHWIDIQDNTTIAGQTAPGDGITIRGWDSKISGQNIIVRYVQFMGNETIDRDAVTISSAKNIIVDHCTITNGVDETFTVKETLNSSFQWNIIAESFKMPSGASESEAKHGFAGIWDGYQVSYHHNLLANSVSRNPRFQGGFKYWYNRFENKMEYINNVVYNWSYQSGYGGDRGDGETNFVNNYYKPGPDTLDDCNTRFFDIDGGKYYIDGNVMIGSDEVTADNTLGFKDYTADSALTDKVRVLLPLEADDAQTAYERVLNEAGAVAPRRSASEARLINDVAAGTGYIVSSVKELGGAPTDVYQSTVADRDGDGMPDEWEAAKGLNSADASDGNAVGDGGYTNFELYLNELAGDYDYSVENPSSSLNVDMQTYFTVGESYSLPVEAKAKADKKIAKLELYEDDRMAAIIDNISSGEFNGEIQYQPQNEGNYTLLLKAYDSDGISTFSSAVPVNVNWAENPGIAINSWSEVNIGNAAFDGKTTINDAGNKVVVKGGGSIGAGDYYYKYTGFGADSEIIVRIDDLKRIDYNQRAGIMLRESIEPSSRYVFFGGQLTKLEGLGVDYFGDYRNNAMQISTNSNGGTQALNIWGSAPKRTSEMTDEDLTGAWLKLKRSGDTVFTSVSSDGVNWKSLDKAIINGLPGQCYIGFVVDAAQSSSEMQQCGRAEFSNVYIDGIPVTSVSDDIYLKDFMVTSYEKFDYSSNANITDEEWNGLSLFATKNGEVSERGTGKFKTGNGSPYGGKYFQLYTNSLSQGIDHHMRIPLADEYRKINISFNAKLAKTGDGVKYNLIDTDGKTVCSVLASGDSWAFDNGAEVVSLNTALSTKLANIKVLLDLDNSSVNISIDGELVGENLEINSSAYISAFEMQMVACDTAVNPAISGVTIESTEKAIEYADINQDGKIMSEDATLALAYMLNPLEYDFNVRQKKAIKVTKAEYITSGTVSAILGKVLDYIGYVFEILQ